MAVQLTIGLLLKNVREELAEEECEMHSRERFEGRDFRQPLTCDEYRRGYFDLLRANRVILDRIAYDDGAYNGHGV